VHGTKVYFVGVGPKGPALKMFLDIKRKKKKKKVLIQAMKFYYSWRREEKQIYIILFRALSKFPM
jgi:hypothetical protein